MPLSLFTACLADPPPDLCRRRTVRRATTGTDGTYTVHLTGRDTQGSFGTVSTMSL